MRGERVATHTIDSVLDSSQISAPRRDKPSPARPNGRYPQARSNAFALDGNHHLAQALAVNIIRAMSPTVPEQEVNVRRHEAMALGDESTPVSTCRLATLGFTAGAPMCCAGESSPPRAAPRSVWRNKHFPTDGLTH